MGERPVSINATLRDVLDNLADNPHGLCVVVDDHNHILGVLTDGDCRRALLKGLTLESPAREAMKTQFIAVDESFTVDQIRLLMRTNGVEQIPIVDDAKCFLKTISQRSLAGRPPERSTPVLILAGGKGRRLGALTENLPKPMLPIAGKPMIEHLIIRLVESKFRDIYISVNYLGDKIEKYFGDGSRWGCRIKYLREEVELGSGGPLGLLDGRIDKPLLVINGDLVTTVDFGSFVDFHSGSNFALTIGVSIYEVQIPFGVVNVNKDGSVASFIEKPIHWCPVSAGLYMVNPDVLSLVPPDQFTPMNTIIESAMQSQLKVGAFTIHEGWNDVGIPSIYHALAEHG